MRSRRALLYMPGDDLKKIKKAITLDVDCICMDLEDGVAINRKQEARQTIAEALRTLDFGRSEKLARINPVGSGLEFEDLQAVLPAHPDGIVVPKIQEAEQVQWVSAQIGAMERRFGWTGGHTCLILIIETARAIIDLVKIAAADPRLEALIFGADDLMADIGGIRTPEGWEVFYARSVVVTYAAAFDLQAIDMVHIDFHDIEALQKECLQGVRLGFSGKQIIHPNQVIPVQEAFTPDAVAITQAQRIMEVFERRQQEGVGAFAMDGKMIDAPTVKAAQRILERAYAAGKVQ